MPEYTHAVAPTESEMWLNKWFGRGKSSLPAPTSPAPHAPVDPAAARVATYLADLFKGHGIDCGRHDVWVVPNETLPAVRGHWTPGEHSGRLDIEVRVQPEVTIFECFAGMSTGESRTALDDALCNFVINSFHVMLSALWNQHDPEQVTRETWEIGGTTFTSFIGNIGRRGSVGHTEPPLPAGLFETLEHAIRSEPLTTQLHWFRFYFGVVKGEPIFEALRDNEPWDAGLEALRSVDWEASDAFYSARLFLMLQPVVD